MFFVQHETFLEVNPIKRFVMKKFVIKRRSSELKFRISFKIKQSETKRVFF